MSATDILEIPDSEKYWFSTKQVERYMRKMAAEKMENGGRDYKDAVADKEKEEEVAPWFGIDADDTIAMAADTFKNGGKDNKDVVADKEKEEEEATSVRMRYSIFNGNKTLSPAPISARWRRWPRQANVPTFKDMRRAPRKWKDEIEGVELMVGWMILIDGVTKDKLGAFIEEIEKILQQTGE
ncbi:hypothetical protein M413DRAFT_434976 [Hebeloma cylindrosporum]|uniref:Uncharacterized protein n=1 Tax=Hebeloma cylindrosporum TaxID=76867 RepID=A0A0C3BTZ1_HEBCY|nr:hypothetical protein M413DRAFT_434976 [Hebeloma cylindrosporum h7]